MTSRPDQQGTAAANEKNEIAISMGRNEGDNSTVASDSTPPVDEHHVDVAKGEAEFNNLRKEMSRESKAA
jgi:hypothetical protein